MQRLLELINSVKLQDIKSIYKDQLYFYILATSSQKKKLKDNLIEKNQILGNKHYQSN